MAVISGRAARGASIGLFLLAALAAPLAAQTGGTISGTVTATDGGQPVQGARIAVTNPPLVALSDPAGRYALRDLVSGKYAVLVTAIGYKPYRATVDLSAGQTATLDVKLDAGSLVLPGIVTSATRVPTETRQVATTINTLQPEEIRTSPSRESQDLLREIPSVELPRTSSLVAGSAQIVSIRGVDEGRTAVLFDGIPISDAWGEWIDWSRVPNGMLDRVEVAEGGQSSLYGNGALGGVISYFSRPLAPGAFTSQFDAGTASARHAYVGVGVPIAGPFTGMVNVDYGEGGGYRLIDTTGPGCSGATTACHVGPIDQDASSIRRNVYARVNYNPSSTLSAFLTGHAFGDNRNVGTPLARQSRDQGNLDLGVNYGANATGMLSLRAWNGRQEEHQRATAVRKPATLANATTACPVGANRVCEDSSAVVLIPSHDWGASAQWLRTGLWHLESFSAGGDFRHVQGAYDENDFSTSCPGASCGNFTQKIWSGGDQALSGAFVQAIAAPVTDLRVELSARVDHWSNTDAMSVDSTSTATSSNVVNYPSRTETAFSPRIGVHYQLLSNLGLRGAVYKAFRAPNLAELYRKQISGTTITLPNPDLSAETAFGREVGFDYAPVQWVQVKGTYYVAEYYHFNRPITLTDPTVCGPTAVTCRQRLNSDRSRSQGIEASVGVKPIQQLLLSAAVNYDDDRLQSGLPATLPNGEKPRVNRVPSPKQTVKAVYTDQLLGTWTGIWRHEGHTTTLRGADLAPFTVVDANVQHQLVPGFTGFLSVENIGDVKYQVDIGADVDAAKSPLISYGLPRTLRLGLMIDR